jgi:hypothetical protein
MWITEIKNWRKDITPLEKFLTERIIQRCDYKESISNQHRTTNGYIQVLELLNFSILSKSRVQTIRTVQVLFEEAKSKTSNNNLSNDIIIQNYFADIKSFVESYDFNNLRKDKVPNLVELNKLIHELNKFKFQLNKGYFYALRKEFFNIDYNEVTKIERNAKKLSVLVDLLIPYLVFKGYAVSSLSEVLRSWIDKKYRITVNRIFRFFNFDLRPLKYIIKFDSPEGDMPIDMLSLLKEELGNDIIEGNVKCLKKEDFALKIFSDDDKLITYQANALDPHSHIRGIYDTLLKKVVQIRERQTLTIFGNLFDNCYWRMPKEGKLYHKIELMNDPINVNSRGRTLYKTLLECSKEYKYQFKNGDGIPRSRNEQLMNSLYYYNLALGSKSIENSLALLWTSLEALLPYRLYNTDIDNVANFVCKSLSLGSISRDIHSFALRVILTNKKNDDKLVKLACPLEEPPSTSNFIRKWYEWLIDTTNNVKRFEDLKNVSELLAFEYSRIAQPLILGTQKAVKLRIESSHESMKYQLQRIYLHRNRIIHAGNLVNEYSNLWMHLEWYIGKLLAYSIIKIELLNSIANLDDLFIELESDHDFITSYLSKNSSKTMDHFSLRLKGILLNYSWQAF